MAQPHMRWLVPRSVARQTVIGAVVLLAIATSCSKPSLPGSLELTEIALGRALAPDGTMDEDSRTNLFWTTDIFYVSVTLEGSASQGSAGHGSTDKVTLQVRCTGPDGKVAAESSRAVVPSGTTVTLFEMPPPIDGRWPAGDYKVEVLINGASHGTKDLNAR